MSPALPRTEVSSDCAYSRAPAKGFRAARVLFPLFSIVYLLWLRLRRARRGTRNTSGPGLLLVLVALVFPSTSTALPRRLILALDGIAYRDMKALQAGVTYTNIWGKRCHRQAFSADEGYFPVSRVISTFPSTSDVGWTDIFGDRPLPGYQRTYFSIGANSQIAISGVTTTMEHEKQMHWQLQNGFLRAMGYVYPLHTYKYEVHELVKHLLKSRSDAANYYVYIRATDDAQHLARDIFAMLSTLDKQLQKVRARYRAREGRNLEILILSDHGDNHAGAGKRIPIRAFLEKAGYRITKSIVEPKDVVLPTAGIESWVEIHNAPGETERLARLLTHLEGVDLVTARVPDRADRFIVMNSKGDRAVIDWKAARDSYRYTMEQGDPIGCRLAVEALAAKHRLDAEGFAAADAWMAETLTNRYPLAPERIARGLTRVTLNPATILLSLDNHYVHSGWLVKKSSKLVPFGGTHGGLDNLNSDGILLSNFAPTRNTTSSRVAGLYDGFPGLRNYRAEEDGAELISKSEQALTRIAREPFDHDYRCLTDDGIYLRIWTPRFTRLDSRSPVQITIKKARQFHSPHIRRTDLHPRDESGRHWTLDHPISFPWQCAYERVYALPANLDLEPAKAYQISGRIQDRQKEVRLFAFTFRTDDRGRPVAY